MLLGLCIDAYYVITKYKYVNNSKHIGNLPELYGE